MRLRRDALAAAAELVLAVERLALEPDGPTATVGKLEVSPNAGNVIPGELEVMFNFRFSNESSADSLKARVHALLDRHRLDYELAWTLGGETFLTPPGTLSRALGVVPGRAHRAEGVGALVLHHGIDGVHHASGGAQSDVERTRAHHGVAGR